jgi:hypothetical protein
MSKWHRFLLTAAIIVGFVATVACGLTAQVGCTQINPTNGAIRYHQQNPACEAVDCDGCGCWCVD